ncbi:MAG TPA: hypothetical protein DCE44_08515 [Verrucomicrobiales bacterium]|nr:hypothetical protein [Verrucomicrobiales bacterium]
MKRSIIITDLTRFKAGNPHVCTAGIDRQTGECIRPMPYLPFTECTRLGILPGGILTGEFTAATSRTAPHTEDCNYQKLTFDGPCSGEEFRNVLVGSCFASVEAGFEVSLPAGEKVIPNSHQVQRSLITLKIAPSDVEIVEDSYKPGSIKLHFTDSSGRRHRFFPITDLGFYDYAQRHRDSGALAELNIEIARQKEVFLRIGLSRSYRSPQGKEGFWMQANGFYTFPTVLRYIRSYPAPEPKK